MLLLLLFLLQAIQAESIKILFISFTHNSSLILQLSISKHIYILFIRILAIEEINHLQLNCGNHIHTQTHRINSPISNFSSDYFLFFWFEFKKKSFLFVFLIQDLWLAYETIQKQHSFYQRSLLILLINIDSERRKNHKLLLINS